MLDFIAPYADQIIGVTQALISCAVIPTIWEGRKVQGVPLLSSLLLSIGLSVIAGCLLSQSLPLAAATTAFGAAMWGVVALERIRENQRL